MNKSPSELYYASSHEWARIEKDGLITVGITNYAQEQLGDIVFVDIPTTHTELSSQDSACVIESTKSASDIYSPVSGIVVSVNASLAEQPELINNHPFSDGWLFKIKPTNQQEVETLMDAETYQNYISTL